ncbi:XdhC family protein [Natrinema salsiterrestre]|uniref:XdhC family protein n=1 Tax=Natrinema salsiterrestre TaxID=2950540 RepID=A0A9Q4L1Q2_9EURY|nr:XdhC family protein [Natrinema salsiterrestre]MDF9745228.1 XdhC family protein [Natrinema salsiterrestre]
MTADTPDADDETTSDRTAVATDGDLAEREHALRDREEPYARATVVRREPPVSANVGDRALVTANGDLHGWVGGAACAQSRVASEARAAIAEGEPRLIGLAPDPDDVDRPGLAAFPMMCHSEGTLEIFVEPMIPATRLLVVGDSPIARSLVTLATELDVEIAVVDPDAAAADLPDRATVISTLEPDEIADAVGAGPFVVVASMGEYDARGVAAGVLADAPYVGLVASDSRADEVVERAAGLLDRDPDAVREAVTNPAGVDISATTGPEIATSLLAELIDVRADSETTVASGSGSSGGSADGESTDAGDADATAEAPDSGGTDATDDSTSADERVTDPVCGMAVDPADSASVAHDGTTYYFCCHGCADSFRTDPDEYLATDEEAMESA